MIRFLVLTALLAGAAYLIAPGTVHQIADGMILLAGVKP